MLTLTLPSNGSFSDLLDMVKDSALHIKIMRDAYQDIPELSDEFSFARGKDAISDELDKIQRCKEEGYRDENEGCCGRKQGDC